MIPHGEKKCMTSQNIPVLMYPHVGPEGGSLTVAVEHFEQQIRGLAKQGYHSLRADEIEAFFKGEAVPEKSVVLTFDDGYLDNWVYAHPVLKKYGMTGIMFVITSLIGEDRKSTRLNSSHVSISYAVFCLNKKYVHSRTIS